MRKWLARFSYSLLILGGFLFYQVYLLQTSEERIPTWQIIMILIGGMLAISMGASGIRYRHEMMRRDEP